MQKSFTKNRVRLILVLTAVLFGGSLLWSLWILRPADSRIVEVVRDGEVLYTFDLDHAEDQRLVVTYGQSSNTILIESGKICVETAECPDQTCVKMGWLHSDNLPIVCLPNHLMIRYGE